MGEITCVCRGEITIVDMREIKRVQAWGENTGVGTRKIQMEALGYYFYS